MDWAYANRVPVLTEGLDMGEELWLDVYLGFEHRLDLLCRLQAFVIWLWRYVESSWREHC